MIWRIARSKTELVGDPKAVNMIGRAAEVGVGWNPVEFAALTTPGISVISALASTYKHCGWGWCRRESPVGA